MTRGHAVLSERSRKDKQKRVALDRKTESFLVVPLKKFPVRVAKYDVRLRDVSLRAAHAMHAILTRMVLFQCHECNERFPAFHPAYTPPPMIANEMEILRKGKSGVAACSIEVASWDELPDLEPEDGVAQRCFGTCLRCRRDMDAMALEKGCEDVIPRFGHLNHMDPCFRFPFDDLKSLFDSATLVESMLVALEHMQVSFVTLAWSTGLRKFRRNTISFPQDIAAFARRHGMMRRYQVGSRVNSSRGPYGDAKDPARPARRAADLADEDRELFAVDASGCMVYPATVREVHPDGRLLLDYDLGGSGYEL